MLLSFPGKERRAVSSRVGLTPGDNLLCSHDHGGEAGGEGRLPALAQVVVPIHLGSGPVLP